jgi:hypothetical protein
MKNKVIGFFTLCLLVSGACAQSDCPSNQILRFDDGAIGCMNENKLFTIERNLAGNRVSIISSLSNHEKYLIAMTKNPKSCPIDYMRVDWGSRMFPQSRLLNRCEDLIAEQATKQNKSPAGCECEIVYDSTRSKNITLTKSEFELRSRAWLAAAQNADQFKDQFSPQEKQANSIFLAEYMRQSNTASSSGVANAAADKKLQDELAKKQLLEQQEKALAEKARIEKEKLLAEEKRIAQEIAQKGQLDKDAANKARIEKEKSLAEEKRIALEIAKVQALEKEKAELIAKLQQEKDAREKAASSKAVSDEARILALRKELEKEIRASIQSESSGNSKTIQGKVFANRKALVIGNDSYQKVSPLANAREDAKVLAESLNSLGYKVTLKLDVTENNSNQSYVHLKTRFSPVMKSLCFMLAMVYKSHLQTICCQ